MCTRPSMQTSKIVDCEVSNHSEGSQMKVVRKSNFIKRSLQEVAADRVFSIAAESLQHMAKVNC